jgi:predicted nucleic acid-binding protein
MIILDTNVLSELMRQQPSKAVSTWVGSRPAASLFTSTITQAEILYGVALLPAGARRDRLRVAVEGILAEEFSGRVLGFDTPAARAFGSIAAARRQAGHPISHADAQVAAIAVSREATLATRNVSDFEGCGLEIVGPWG